MAVQMPPILKDATGQDMVTQLTNIVTQLTALLSAVSPQASGVGVSTANMHYITEDEAQGALAELDAQLYATNSSLAQLGTNLTSKSVTYTMETTIAPAGNALVDIDITNSPSVLHIIEGFRAQSGGAGSVVFSNIYFSDNNTITARLLNLGSSATTTAMKLTFDYK